MKRKIFSPALLQIFEKYFKNEHSKFIHASPLRMEDLHQSFEHEDRTFTLVGLNDEGLAVLHEQATGHYFVTSKASVKEMAAVTTA